MTLSTHSVSISYCPIHGCPMKVLPNLRWLFSDLFFCVKCYTNMSQNVSWVITDQSRLPIPLQGKQNHLCHLYPSTIWQVVHMQYVEICCLFCVSMFMRTNLQKMVIVIGTTMSNSYITRLPLSYVHYYACLNLDAVQSVLPNIGTWSH
jgi:hypothetical protein